MRKPIQVVLAIAVLACSAAASAQVPTFAPYGAWRGRIRYVEGPWRTRSTIHWGNGVTPTGGQVIMHGLTAAENVLTNPDFLSKVLSGGLRDAEAVAKAEAKNAEIQAAILDIRTRNQTIANLNAPVLMAWDLEPTKLTPLVAEVPEGDSLDAPTELSVPELYDSYMELGKTIAKLPGSIRASASKASVYGQAVESRGASWGLNEEQLESVKQFNDFVRRVLASLPEGQPAEAGEDLANQPREELITEYALTLMRLFKDCNQVIEVSAKRKKVAEELNTIVVLPVVKRSMANLKQISDKAASWGDIPTIEKNTFDIPVSTGDDESTAKPPVDPPAPAAKPPAPAPEEEEDPFAPKPDEDVPV